MIQLQAGRWLTVTCRWHRSQLNSDLLLRKSRNVTIRGHSSRLSRLYWIYWLSDAPCFCLIVCCLEWSSISPLSFHFHEGTRNREEMEILIFSTKMLSIQSSVPTKEPNKTTKTDTSPLMTKLHRFGHSCDCISDLYCIVSNTTHCHSKGKRVIKIWLHCWISFKGEPNCAQLSKLKFLTFVNSLFFLRFSFSIQSKLYLKIAWVWLWFAFSTVW